MAVSGKKFWQISENFFKMCDFNNQIIFYSGFVLKELQWVAPGAFAEEEAVFADSRFKKVIALVEDYEAARKLEALSNFSISFLIVCT